MAAAAEIAAARQPPVLARPVNPFATPTLSPVADRAPPPRIAQILDDATAPSLRVVTSASEPHVSTSQVSRLQDLYRLQLDFEDTPARPLPKNASAVLASHDADATLRLSVEQVLALQRQLLSQRSAPASLVDLRDADLSDLEAIPDLDALAQALGFKNVADCSIPSYEGAPVDDADDPDASDELPTLAPQHVVRLRSSLDSTPPGMTAEALRQAFATEPPDPREATNADVTPARPALRRARATTEQPVIVRIPSRPKVSAAARAQAHKLYIAAVEELAKGDRVGALGHLRLAIHYDEAMPLYTELLAQLEGHASVEGSAAQGVAPGHLKSADEPALLVRTPSGRFKRAFDLLSRGREV